MGSFKKISYQLFIQDRQKCQRRIDLTMKGTIASFFAVLLIALCLLSLDIIQDNNTSGAWILGVAFMCFIVPLTIVSLFVKKQPCPGCNANLLATNITPIPITQFGKCPHCLESIFEDFPPPTPPHQPQDESTPSIFPIPLETYQKQVDKYQKAFKAGLHYFLLIFILPALIACAILGFSFKSVFDSSSAWSFTHILLFFTVSIAIILILCKYLSSLYRQISARRFPPPLPCPNCAFDTLAYPTLVIKTASCPRCAHQLIVES